MSFYESFWVVAGTAAPVIALAAVISLNDTARAQFTVNDATSDAFAVARLDATDEMYQRLDKRGSSLDVLRIAQLLNLCLQAGLLAVSLLSLTFHRNLIPAWICVVAPTAGVLLLAYAGLTVTRAQELTRLNLRDLRDAGGKLTIRPER
jgi:hypothetical protein